MKPASSATAAPGRYRVTIQSTDWFEVDVYAPRADEAQEIAEKLDGGLVERCVDSEWKAVSAEEVSAEDFDPQNDPEAVSRTQ